MSNTFAEYVKEVELFDDAIDYTESAKYEVGKALFQYNEDCRIAKQKFFFEGTAEEPFLEEAKENLFAKIGRKVMEFIAKVRKFFGDLISKITGVSKETDIAKAEKILSKQDPEVRSKLLKSIADGDITVSDVAKFEKDIGVLVDQVMKEQIDPATLEGKSKIAMDNFIKNGKKAAVIAGAATGFMDLFKIVRKASSEADSSKKKFETWCKKIENAAKQNKAAEPSRVTAALRTVMSAFGVETKEYYKRVSLLERMSKTINSVCHSDAAKNIADNMAHQADVNKRHGINKIAKRNAEYAAKQQSKSKSAQQTNDRDERYKKFYSDAFDFHKKEAENGNNK